MGYTTRVLGWLLHWIWRKAKAVALVCIGFFVMGFDIVYVISAGTGRSVVRRDLSGFNHEFGKFRDRWGAWIKKYWREGLRGTGALD